MKKILTMTVSAIIAMLIAISMSLTAFAVDVDYMDKHGEEGKRLWENYLDVLTPVKEEKYPELLDSYNYLSSNFKNYYNNLTKRDEQELLDMSDYEQLLWDTSVLRMTYKGASYRSYEDWKTRYALVVQNYKHYIKDDDEYTKIRDAYHALMDWSYNYYEATGGFYNFIEDKDSFDYINEYYDTDTSSKEKETSKDTEDSTSSKDESSEKIEPSSQTSSITTSSESNPESSKGIWSGVVSNIKNNIATIIIAILFLVALAYIAIQKKRYNINDSQE